MIKHITVYNQYELYENGRWYSHHSQKFLKPMLNSSGYERVALYEHNKRKFVFTHIKVIEYFGDCNGKHLPANTGTLRELGVSIDHIDRNKHNNSRNNLEIVTHKENCRRRNETRF